MSKVTEFAMHADFLASLRVLAQKGGPGKRSSDTAFKAWERAQKPNATFEEVFKGMPLTYHGESRISNCRKFDLAGFITDPILVEGAAVSDALFQLAIVENKTGR